MDGFAFAALAFGWAAPMGEFIIALSALQKSASKDLSPSQRAAYKFVDQ
jgi:hypothetical protein